jgi:hypothetical protein
MAYNKFKEIKCSCGRKYVILKPWAVVGISKGHVHCPQCNLEWHLTMAGKIYAHPWKIGGVVWKKVDPGIKKEYLVKKLSRIQKQGN